MITIEPAHDYDAPDILPLIQEFFAYVNMDLPALIRRMSYPWIHIEKCLENGTLTGFSDWEITDKRNGIARLNGIAVYPAHRGKGHGDALMKSGEKWAREKGMKKITLFVAQRNTGAQKLYRENGYAKVGMNPKKIDGEISEIWEKKLA